MTGASSEPRSRLLGYALVAAGTLVVSVVVAATLVSISQRKAEGLQPHLRVVEVDEDTIDPKVWAQNWPHQYDSYRRTVDHERTRFGGSSAIPEQKLDKHPWLRQMWSGYAFSIDYREARGHAYMLYDQEHTERVLQREQPGACLHCHASVMPAYRHAGAGDELAGFIKLSGLPYHEARNITDDRGQRLIDHPISCVDCHDPDTMSLRITRPAFKVGIAALKAHTEGTRNYDVNRDASRQEMRSYVCGQCHVEYYFDPSDKRVVYPWAKGLGVDAQESYYDEIGFSDWTHGVTGAGVLKAQHPEFEMFSQGTHAQAGVACADCHMPYERVGARKVTNHHVRSPLLGMAGACMTCHGGSELELRARVDTIQDRTQALIQRASTALVDMLDAIATAQANGATDEQLAEALALQRKAQWRLDWVYSENSHGFHAPQESARILADAIDYARRAQLIAQRFIPTEGAAVPPEPEPVLGVTASETPE